MVKVRRAGRESIGYPHRLILIGTFSLAFAASRLQPQ